MKRRTFLGLLGLLGCKDELEDMNISKKLWWLNTSVSQGLDAPAGLPLLTLNSSSVIAAYDGNAADNDGWFGRCSVAKRSDNVIILTYREAQRHDHEGYAVMHIKFSDDYGATWSDQDKYLDGTAITGFPLRPTGAGNPSGNNRGPVEGTLIICPNGDVLCHMWSSDYSTDNDGAWQARSTDGGLTWNELARVTWLGTITDNDEVFFTEGNVTVGSTIYTTVRKITSKSPYAEELYIATSSDNGTTWTVISQVTTAGNDNSSGEASLEYLGSGRFIMTMRSAKNLNAYYTFSEDSCLTWATPVDITIDLGIGAWLGRTTMRTRSHVQGLSNWWTDRLLIICGFTGGVNNTSLGTRRNCAWTAVVPEDYDLSNISWYGPYFLDDVGYDSGYGDFFYNPNTDEYVQCAYRAPTSVYDASAKQYNFSLSFLDVTGNLLVDRFTDGTIDTSLWDVTDPADGVTISETGGRLIFSANPASPVTSTNTNYVASDLSFNQTTRVFRSTVFRGATSVNQSGVFKCYNSSDTYATARQAQISKGASNKIRIAIYNGTSFIYDVTTTIDWPTTGVGVKIVIESNNDIKFYYYVTSWNQMGTTQNYDLGGALKLSMNANCSGLDTGTPTVEFDNVYVSDYDYNNSIPY